MEREDPRGGVTCTEVETHLIDYSAYYLSAHPQGMGGRERKTVDSVVQKRMLALLE